MILVIDLRDPSKSCWTSPEEDPIIYNTHHAFLIKKKKLLNHAHFAFIPKHLLMEIPYETN